MNLKIWVVEDDPKYRDILVSYLALLGYQARVFSSGETCLPYLDESPDIVILDHNLGGDTKDEDILHKIKLVNQNIAVIHLSSKDKVSALSDLYKNRSDDFIGKDSASLLRLKIKIEQITTSEEKRRKQRNRNILWSSIFLLIFVLSAIVLIFLVDVW